MSASVSLDDKYQLDRGRVFMTGTQALVRLLLAQKQRDAATGLNTAGFVSGYRGSPLGSVDQELWKAKRHLDANNIVFQPGINEELAATAVWGSQMAGMDPKATVDGVFGMWYGKGPGVDRSGDVLKHANIAGTSKFGGVLAMAGDDHTCKSSTLPHQSEQAFIAASIPVMNPSGVREFLEFGLHGWAMSRYSGCWVGFKSISETIETTSSFDIDPTAVDIRLPSSADALQDRWIRWPDPPMEQERRLLQDKLRAVLDYVRANKLNRQEWVAPQAKLGIVTTGKSYLDVREALALLGIDEERAPVVGLRLLKIGVTWPLEPSCIAEFAQGLTEILVVEEKRPILEQQIKDQLYNAPAGSRPRVVGKTSGEGDWVRTADAFLLPAHGELSPAVIANVLGQRILEVLGRDVLGGTAAAAIPDLPEAMADAGAALQQRLPYFCSGCPHNTSTKVPEGSRAGAGIGCHGMATWMGRNTTNITQMGGEGAAWIGHAPFTAEGHVFQNLGDGTYSHSGSLAIRAAIAAKINITYKILANDAVAMTGGQPVEGSLNAIEILKQVMAEGVKEVHLVSDEPEGWKAMGVPDAAVVSHRDRLQDLQVRLRDVPGVSVIVYAQTCAAEKRRRRKKKQMIDPQKRVVINEAVCEGCGDCGVQSNCVSILPLETPLGRKRMIDQSSCNKDFSCVKGFCPSFVSVVGASLRKRAGKAALPPTGLPVPELPQLEQPYNILVTGIGGTGVVTIGALIGMAAHIEGKGVVIMDMAGLAQKGGAVMSHVRLASDPESLFGARVGQRQADLVLGCDLMVAAGKEATGTMASHRTRAVLNADVAPSSGFVSNPDWQSSPDALLERVRSQARTTDTIDASTLATALMGDAVATNVFLLGYAWQKGMVPLSEGALLRAIELNGAAVAMNRAAFAWGRQAAIDPNPARAAAGLTPSAQVIAMPQRTPALEALIEDRVKRLADYQDAAYARRYESFVREIAAKERERTGGDRLAREVGVSFYKLMAYKDEYEVARLFLRSDFLERIGRDFEGPYKLQFHLAPPLLSRRGGDGHPVKGTYGPWVLWAYRLLARARRVRGSVFDVFGYTAERRSERSAIGEFEALMRDVAARVTPERLATALQLARLPQTVRGFGHVKARNAEAAATRQRTLLLEFEAEPVESRIAA